MSSSGSPPNINNACIFRANACNCGLALELSSISCHCDFELVLAYATEIIMLQRCKQLAIQNTVPTRCCKSAKNTEDKKLTILKIECRKRYLYCGTCLQLFSKKVHEKLWFWLTCKITAIN